MDAYVEEVVRAGELLEHLQDHDEDRAVTLLVLAIEACDESSTLLLLVLNGFLHIDNLTSHKAHQRPYMVKKEFDMYLTVNVRVDLCLLERDTTRPRERDLCNVIAAFLRQPPV